MKFRSYGTPEFWRAYREQPAAVRALAQKTYRLWSEDALHPSLHFKIRDAGYEIRDPR